MVELLTSITITPLAQALILALTASGMNPLSLLLPGAGIISVYMGIRAIIKGFLFQLFRLTSSAYKNLNLTTFTILSLLQTHIGFLRANDLASSNCSWLNCFIHHISSYIHLCHVSTNCYFSRLLHEILPNRHDLFSYRHWLNDEIIQCALFE